MGCFRSVNKLAQGRQIEMSAHAHSRSMMISLTWINGGLGRGSIDLRFHSRCGCKPALIPTPLLALRFVRFSNVYIQKNPLQKGSRFSDFADCTSSIECAGIMTHARSFKGSLSEPNFAP